MTRALITFLITKVHLDLRANRKFIQLLLSW